MKTKLSLLVLSIFAAHFAMAQLNLGVKAGTNITKIDGKSFSDEFRYGYHLGGFAEIGLGGKLSIQPEVVFNQYHSKLDSNFQSIYKNAMGDVGSGNVKLNYLSIPILLNYKLGNVLSLQAGPQFGVLMNKDNSFMENGKNAFDNGDLSMLGGAQINISKLRITGRYGIGLNNINDIDNRDKWTNQTIQLSLGLAF